MNIEIQNEVILQRILDRLESLKKDNHISDEIYTDYKTIFSSPNDIDHGRVILFCIDTNTSYKYIVLGEYPIYDVDNTNTLYKELIDSGKYTIPI